MIASVALVALKSIFFAVPYRQNYFLCSLLLKKVIKNCLLLGFAYNLLYNIGSIVLLMKFIVNAKIL